MKVCVVSCFPYLDFFSRMVSYYAAQPGFELLNSSDFPASVSQVAGTTEACHMCQLGSKDSKGHSEKHCPMELSMSHTAEKNDF